MSLLLRELAPLLPLIAAVAVCDVAGARAEIKWHNDVVLDSHTTSGGPGLAKPNSPVPPWPPVPPVPTDPPEPDPPVSNPWDTGPNA